ncbi:MAG: lmo0937 family membrane protein [Thermoanaerobaculia bacterium]
MLLILAIILLVAWLCGFLVFHVASGLIHLIVVVAIILFILHFIRRR